MVQIRAAQTCVKGASMKFSRGGIIIISAGFVGQGGSLSPANTAMQKDPKVSPLTCVFHTEIVLSSMATKIQRKYRLLCFGMLGD